MKAGPWTQWPLTQPTRGWGKPLCCGPTPGPARAPAGTYPDGLGELLQGGDGDGVRPRLSKPAEATSELLVGAEQMGSHTCAQTLALPMARPALGKLTWPFLSCWTQRGQRSHM